MPTLNLIPVSVQLAQARARRIRCWGVLVAIGAAATAAPLVIDEARLARAEELGRLNTDLQAALVVARGELRDVAARAADAALQVDRADALRGKRNWSGLLALIGECLPADCWLTSMATDPDAPAAATEGRRPPGNADGNAQVVIDAPRKLRLHGLSVEAASPLKFVSRLKETGVFRAVALEQTSRSQESGERFRFGLVCEW